MHDLPRPQLADSVISLWHQHPHARLAVAVLAGYDVTFGLVLALSAGPRTSSASFVTINDLGGPVAWGAALAVVGASVFAATTVSRRTVGWALAVAAMAHLFLASGFIVAAAKSPDAALTGIPTYTFAAACHAVQCVLHRRKPSAP